jgi:hypothetical protein
MYRTSSSRYGSSSQIFPGKQDDLDQRIVEFLNQPEVMPQWRQLVRELFDRYRGQQRLLDRLTKISDGFPSAERERGQSYLARYEHQVRQLEKIFRISDQYQKMLIDLKKKSRARLQL